MKFKLVTSIFVFIATITSMAYAGTTNQIVKFYPEDRTQWLSTTDLNSYVYCNQATSLPMFQDPGADNCKLYQVKYPIYVDYIRAANITIYSDSGRLYRWVDNQLPNWSYWDNNDSSTNGWDTDMYEYGWWNGNNYFSAGAYQDVDSGGESTRNLLFAAQPLFKVRYRYSGSDYRYTRFYVHSYR